MTCNVISTLRPILTHVNKHSNTRFYEHCSGMIVYRPDPDSGYPATLPNKKDRNARLGLQSLSYKRKLYGLALCFTIVNMMTKMKPNFARDFQNSTTRGLSVKFGQGDQGNMEWSSLRSFRV